MNAIEIERDSNVDGHIFCNLLRARGVITKATKDYSVRFTPALNITKEEVDEVVEIVEDAVWNLEQHNKLIPKREWSKRQDKPEKTSRGKKIKSV